MEWVNDWRDDLAKQRDILTTIKSKYDVTAVEKETIDYAILLIQKEIDGDMD